VVSEDQDILSAVDALKTVIMEQANTKTLLTSTEFEDLKINAQPNMKTLGPKLRGDVPKVAKKLESIDGYKIREELESKGTFNVQLDDRLVELTLKDIVFDTELPDGVVSADFNGGSVFINTTITNEILSEAMSRELIRRIQDMRKDLDLDVEANIHVFIQCSADFKDLIHGFQDFISHEVRAETFEFAEDKGDYNKKWKIEDEEISVSIKKK
jgi:isoleucyl-tRNA synthetase